MPGRDRYPWVDRIAWLLIAASLVGVLIHGVGRLLASRAKS
ncbi:MAG: hypothetical protein AB2814_05860 [Candidatus Sedimenticola endophacoides]